MQLEWIDAMAAYSYMLAKALDYMNRNTAN